MICPKCNYILSNKTLVCVKCGYVLNYDQPDSKDLYDMILKQINATTNNLFSYRVLSNYGVSNEECRTLLGTIGNTILKGIYKGNITYLYDEFLRFGYVMDFALSNDEYINPANSVIESKLREKGENIAYKKKNMLCPRCTSSNLQIDRISTFFNGGFRWKHHCRNCGYLWKVK